MFSVKKIKLYFLEVFAMNDNRFLQFLGSNFGRVLMTVFFTIIIWGIEYALISTENENIALIISVICCFFWMEST